MGLFDYFRSSFDLGKEFTDTICQTKTIDEDGSSMSFYWLDPSGRLWYADYRGTTEFKVFEEGDPEYDERAWANFANVPNGNHGKFRPWRVTLYAQVYPEMWEGEWEDWPTMKLHFVNGVLMDYEEITKNSYQY